MGHFINQYIADCDARTSDDDIYDRMDYGRTNSLERARQNAQSGAELGSLKARYSAAHVAAREAQYRAIIQELSHEYAELRAAGDFERAKLVKQQGEIVIKQYLEVQA